MDWESAVEVRKVGFESRAIMLRVGGGGGGLQGYARGNVKARDG